MPKTEVMSCILFEVNALAGMFAISSYLIKDQVEEKSEDNKTNQEKVA